MANLDRGTDCYMILCVQLYAQNVYCTERAISGCGRLYSVTQPIDMIYNAVYHCCWRHLSEQSVLIVKITKHINVLWGYWRAGGGEGVLASYFAGILF